MSRQRGLCRHRALLQTMDGDTPVPVEKDPDFAVGAYPPPIVGALAFGWTLPRLSSS